MATFTSQQEAWLSWAVKRLLNKGHISEAFLPGEDPAPAGGNDQLPSHPILSAYQIVGRELTIPPPVLSNTAEADNVRRYGTADSPPTTALALVKIPAAPDNRAWIAVDGSQPTDTPLALTGPGVGFLDEWVDGVNPTPNAAGQTYKARFWYGTPSPRHGGELKPDHPAGPLWDPSTGILVFTNGNPYEYGIPEGALMWFSGFLYVGDSIGQVVDTLTASGQVWNKIDGCVPSGLLGLGSLNQSVTISINPVAADRVTNLVFQNGAALVRGTDYTFAGDGTSVTFTQARVLLEAGDEIQVLYVTS